MCFYRNVKTNCHKNPMEVEISQDLCKTALVQTHPGGDNDQENEHLGRVFVLMERGVCIVLGRTRCVCCTSEAWCMCVLERVVMVCVCSWSARCVVCRSCVNTTPQMTFFCWCNTCAKEVQVTNCDELSQQDKQDENSDGLLKRLCWRVVATPGISRNGRLWTRRNRRPRAHKPVEKRKSSEASKFLLQELLQVLVRRIKVKRPPHTWMAISMTWKTQICVMVLVCVKMKTQQLT